MHWPLFNQAKQLLKAWMPGLFELQKTVRKCFLMLFFKVNSKRYL